MALGTAGTYLKYGTCQIETTTVVGTITLAGNATFTITGSGITGSPKTISVAVLVNDTATVVAGKAVTAINLDSAVTALYTASQNGADVILTRKLPAINDATLNIAYTNGNCTGLTPDATSTHTKAGVAYASLMPIISYPDLGSTPNKLDTTDLSATQFKTSILGLQEIPDLTFEGNYDESLYSTINGLTSMYGFRLEFNTNGTDGIYTWNGHCAIYATGGGVDEVRKMTLVLSAETAISVA